MFNVQLAFAGGTHDAAKPVSLGCDIVRKLVAPHLQPLKEWEPWRQPLQKYSAHAYRDSVLCHQVYELSEHASQFMETFSTQRQSSGIYSITTRKWHLWHRNGCV